MLGPEGDQSAAASQTLYCCALRQRAGGVSRATRPGSRRVVTCWIDGSDTRSDALPPAKCSSLPLKHKTGPDSTDAGGRFAVGSGGKQAGFY